jgi:hypothetical protein
MKGTIPKKDTLFRPKLYLMLIIWTKMRPTCASKNLKECVVWEFMDQEFKRIFHLQKS